MHRWWMMSSSIVTQHCQNTREPYNTLQLQADSAVSNGRQMSRFSQLKLPPSFGITYGQL